MDIQGSCGVAVREYPLKWREGGRNWSRFADYLLCAGGRAIGVVEAKPAGHSLQGVVVRSKHYTDGLDRWVPAWDRPLPCAYESTGVETQFTNGLDPELRSRETFMFHRPEELLRLQHLQAAQLRGMLKALPELAHSKLWPVQHLAIVNLEKSLAAAKPRALIQMATGSGKTYTAVTSCYRRILTELPKRGGMLGEIFRKARQEIQNPATLKCLIVDLIDREDWMPMQADVKGGHFRRPACEISTGFPEGRGPALHASRTD